MDCPACIAIESGKGIFDVPIIFESENIVAYTLTSHAASHGHCLVLPKTHYEKMNQIPDETLKEIIVALKKLANILDFDNYNILQNNGSLSFQTLFHAHFHLIPKHSEEDGLRYLRDEGTFGVIEQADIVEKVTKNWNS